MQREKAIDCNTWPVSSTEARKCQRYVWQPCAHVIHIASTTVHGEDASDPLPWRVGIRRRLRQQLQDNMPTARELGIHIRERATAIYRKLESTN